MIWSICHVSLFFPQRGQDAVQQAESRPLMEEKGLKPDWQVRLALACSGRVLTGVLRLRPGAGERLTLDLVQFLGRMTVPR